MPYKDRFLSCLLINWQQVKRIAVLSRKLVEKGEQYI